MPGPLTVAAELLVHLLRRVRQERREHDVAVAHRLQRDVQDGAHALGVLVLQLPRRLVRDVLVDLADDAHRLCHGGLLPRLGQQVTDGAERCGHRREQRMVRVDELSAVRDGADVLRCHGDRAVDEVAPARDELVVVAPEELGPGEVGVLRLGPATAMKYRNASGS
jgi:hypothetical protein